MIEGKNTSTKKLKGQTLKYFTGGQNVDPSSIAKPKYSKTPIYRASWGKRIRPGKSRSTVYRDSFHTGFISHKARFRGIELRPGKSGHGKSGFYCEMVHQISNRSINQSTYNEQKTKPKCRLKNI